MQNYYLSDDMHGRFAEVKELPDITKYVCYAEKSLIDYPVRELCERKSFDIRKRINEVKEEETFRMLEQMETKRAKKIAQFEGRFNTEFYGKDTEVTYNMDTLDDLFDTIGPDEDLAKTIRKILEENDE